MTSIAEAYDISAHHLSKVAQSLARLGYIHTQRGRGGGLRLLEDASDIRLGDVVRGLEGGEGLLECVHASDSDCLIHHACALRSVLGQAERAFYAELDAVSVAELVSRSGPKLLRLLGAKPPKSPSPR